MATVLLAGEDIAALAAIGAAIEAEGHRLIEVRDGFEAVEAALNSAPDLVLLETAMPVYSGIEAARLLRADPSVPAATPIVLLCSAADLDPRVVERSGASGTLPKSLSAPALRDALVRYLGDKAAG